MNKVGNKFHEQNKLYAFPYHYIPVLDKNSGLSLVRKLAWGVEYLCYQQHVYEKVVEQEPRSVLEVGCGDGYLIGALASEGRRSKGIDLSEEAISFAKAFNPEVDFQCVNLDEETGKYEVVLSVEVLEHVPDELIAPFLNGLSNVLTDDGKLIISVPTTNFPLHKKHYRHYNLELFKKQLSESGANLEVVSVEYVYNPPWWISPFIMMLSNRHVTLEIKKLTSWVWKKIWSKYRFASKDNGLHMVLELKKNP